MRNEIAVETLKTGEALQIECVLTPDTERADQIKPFLGHKPRNYLGHIEAAFAGACDGLETRFYIGLLDGQMVGNVMTVESQGVGILGHVHTRSDQRRKGICQSIMRHQMQDFRDRGGHVLLLGTGYRSPAYHIYESFGFLDWEIGELGAMRYDNPADTGFETRFFAPAPCAPVRAGWRHWPLAALLAATPAPAYLRSLAMGVWGVTLLEGAYCSYLYRQSNHPEARAAVLESDTGAVVALATCLPDERWDGAVWLLDLIAHPMAETAGLAGLLQALPLPEGKVHCYADPRDTQKIAALESVGFHRSAVLPEQFRQKERWHDAWLFARQP